jgi:hypothetical protein
MEKRTPPSAAELELSLFGPGIGECLVVHLGSGNWMVVDSCLNQSWDQPVALAYLDQLHVDVGRQVKLIVVTHWHDDHIRGISQVLRAASSARFACSAAIRRKEFLQLVCAHDEIKLVEHTSGFSELAEILAILQARTPGRFERGPDHWAIEGQCLYSGVSGDRVEVHALSPSSQTVTDSMGGLACELPLAGQPIRRFPCLAPNDLSVALLVKTTDMHLLLGADLEKGRDDRRGWGAIISSAVRPKVLSSGYKVAHHGSANADLDEIWSTLVVKNLRALLTPYARGVSPRPTEEDIRRIKGKTQHVYCTVWPPTEAPPRRNTDRAMNQIARVRRAVSKRPGHIRLRVPFNGGLDDISIELFDGARHLQANP